MREPEKICISGITFIADQDGPAEQELKSKLEPLLRGYGVSQAYLVRVRYLNSTTDSVVLGLKAKPDEQLVRDVVQAFSFFSVSQSLDVLFLSASQLREISKVAVPFLSSTSIWERLLKRNK